MLIVTILCFVAVFSLYVFDIGPETEAVYPGGQVTDLPDALPANSAGEDLSPAPAGSPGQPAPEETPDAGGQWQLVWSDDFNGPYLDMEKWAEVDRRDNYNNELQYYTPANSNIEDGCLYLTARKQEKDGKAYTSAMVQSMNKFSFCCGRIEARMKVPSGKGLFPAFWLLTYDGEIEIDVMENIGNKPTLFYGVIHYVKGGRWRKDMDMAVNESPEEFHVYALEWETDELKWYIDDTLFFRTGQGIPTQKMYIIFTLAVGGDWPGSPDKTASFPCSMVIDYVRYYQHQ